MKYILLALLCVGLGVRPARAEKRVLYSYDAKIPGHVQKFCQTDTGLVMEVWEVAAISRGDTQVFRTETLLKTVPYTDEWFDATQRSSGDMYPTLIAVVEYPGTDRNAGAFITEVKARNVEEFFMPIRHTEQLTLRYDESAKRIIPVVHASDTARYLSFSWLFVLIGLGLLALGYYKAGTGMDGDMEAVRDLGSTDLIMVCGIAAIDLLVSIPIAFDYAGFSMNIVSFVTIIVLCFVLWLVRKRYVSRLQPREISTAI